MIPLIDLQRQRASIDKDIERAVKRVIEGGQFILGPETRQFEEEFADYLGVEHCIGVGNGTDAITLALRALGIGPGHTVLVPVFTFFATVEAVILCGATPIFVDVEPHSFNISINSITATCEKLTDNGTPANAVIVVDLFGRPCDYSSLEALCKAENLRLIADVAQGIGGEHAGRKLGSYGDIAATSFFPAKPLGCYGDGGAIMTSNNTLADKIRSLREHGKGQHKYENVAIGTNSRLDEVQAAVLRAKLPILDWEIEQRNKNATNLSERLSQYVQVPTGGDFERDKSAWAQYTITHGKRDQISEKLAESGIGNAIYYPKPLHLQPAVCHLEYSEGAFPNAEVLAQTVLSIPVHPYLETNEIETIADAVVEALE